MDEPEMHTARCQVLDYFKQEQFELREDHILFRFERSMEFGSGERGLVDSAGVMAMFQLNTRAADAAGILVEDGTLSGRNKVGELFGFDSRPDGRAP